MKDNRIDIIATTVSGSVKDWSKVKQIIPEFHKQGYSRDQVFLHEAQSHAEARKETSRLVRDGSRILISAGGSGTFNSVLEGLCDSGVNVDEVRLGFLRKGSADLLGKVLGMPDEISPAIDVLAKCIREDQVVPCDILTASTGQTEARERHFVGYGGCEIFGRIPYFTESRFKKFYKGLLSLFFGDLGPFSVGMGLATLNKMLHLLTGRKRKWKIEVDGTLANEGYYQTFIIVNGDLGPDLPYARSKALGNREFYCFALKDLGIGKMIGQIRYAWDASILNEPERWGFESYCMKKALRLLPEGKRDFPLNVDGSTMMCTQFAQVQLDGQIRLYAARS